MPKAKLAIGSVTGNFGIIFIVILSIMIGSGLTMFGLSQIDNNENELQSQIDLLQDQLNATIIILKSHEAIIQQHNMQINQVTNNTNTIGIWGLEFSHNVNERLVALEKQQ